ncbi:MAG: precorrin-3B C(17)-methyltransferase [spirochete symbiont of Stewartia floridana]|nr:MAG: precorrin-3B C(17)-methyltransferase [spirochete symbiont of Stewartia floridana]
MHVVSIGPGDADHLTAGANMALQAADVIAGYDGYLQYIADYLEGKEVISSGMRGEVERCRNALSQFRGGRRVVLVSGGDAGVYGLAGLVLELMSPAERASLLILPGVTSATACAALLGAPLTHDFAVISLSDLLTDAKLIEKRLDLAAKGDFVTVLYNPRSLSRRHLFLRTIDIFLKHREAHTPVGLVRNAYRDEQRVEIVQLTDLYAQDWVDMKTTVIIGNSQTMSSGHRMITPRGYQICRTDEAVV